ncbi:hypothetical protein ANN_02586 [Periplaneta americana]|uniref:Uncharacterized protein n=1 Tax=Periplaneta americana TaxID=6978 RepID=A0ABQ8U072_PERAM|nr:hypothetical protein ANN_02586 [Periplaneta americana]
MAGLCEGGNEPSGSLKAICVLILNYSVSSENPVQQTSYNGWEDHRANHTIPPFWLDDRPPLLRHVNVRPAAGWSDLALQVCSAMDLLFFFIIDPECCNIPPQAENVT